jgi:hypothetical protein
MSSACPELFRILNRCGVAGVLLIGLVCAQADQPLTFQNTRPGVKYVGSQDCSACHAALAKHYRRATPMGHSMGSASQPSELARAPRPVAVPSGKPNGFYEVFRKGQNLYQREYQKDSQGQMIFERTYKLEYVVGAGQNGYTYLFRRDGNFLFEAPLTYYTRSGTWELSPIYDVNNYGFNRPILPACLWCHNGQPRPVPQRDALYKEPPFRFGEMAISCEACHGPGELHSAKWRTGGSRRTGALDTSIVSPTRLNPRVADDICRFCHQGGNAVVLQPGKDHHDFRPGEPMYKTLGIFKVPLSEQQREEANRLETLPPARGTIAAPGWWRNSSLELSKCYLASGGKMGCLTCHEIHKRPDAKSKVAYFRKKCLQCHSESACRIGAAERRRESPEDNCIACHMPQQPMAGIAHTAATNHRIVRRTGQPLPDIAFRQGPRQLQGLLYLNGPVGDDGSSVSALMKLAVYAALVKRRPEFRQPYLAVLAELSKSDPDNPVVLSALGHEALQRGEPAAVDYLSRALERNKEFPTTMLVVDLAEALARTGRSQEAIRVLTDAVERSPYASILYKALMLRYGALREMPQLLEITKKYLDVFPEDVEIRALLPRMERAVR